MDKAKLYKSINTLVSIAIALLLLWILFNAAKDKFTNDFLNDVLDDLFNHFEVLFSVLILTLVNWSVETIKWNNEVKKVQTLSFTNLYKSILLGITASAVTPLRLGDLGARLTYIEKDKRSKVLYINSFMANTQLLVTILTGILALSSIENIKDLLPFTISIDSIYMLILIPILLGAYFRSNILQKAFNLFSILKTEDYYIKRNSRLLILALSMIRYIVFCLQFYLVVRIFSADINFIVSSQILAIIFLVKTILPTSFISEVAVRISLSYFIFESFGFEGNIGVVSTFVLWVFNLLIPSLLGVLTLRKVQWFNLKQND